jgi:hypothetical protein
MLKLEEQARVWLVLGKTDMRKSINGLSDLVANELKLDAMSGQYFVFCGRTSEHAEDPLLVASRKAQERGMVSDKLKPFEAILRIINSARKSLASSRKRVLHGRW